MEYLALYRKYRPKELDELVGQSEIKKILANSVKNDMTTHAYLFSGPRGTGKTTMAKLFAKMINCESSIDGNPCNKCESCLNILNSNDVIEIDAASNNGVDEIRELREKATLAPTSAKYKVYIIDEVHMLTTQAFNALLKTLEEPPLHVVFILATTEFYKIPLTITSRCQKFQFSKICVDDIVDRLRFIAKSEKIKIDDDALYEIAKISDGGMRDSINFLDQLRSFNNKDITVQDVYDVCGSISASEIENLFIDIRNNNINNIISFFEKFEINGKNYGKFLEDFIVMSKDVILYLENVNHSYIKNDISYVERISKLFSSFEIYFIISSLNILIDRLKSVSRQSIIVLTNFLLLLYKLNSGEIVESLDVNLVNNVDLKKEEKKYEMAFEFTPSSQSSDQNLTEEQSLNDENAAKSNEFIDDKSKKILINNAFAVASKEVKSNLQSKMKSISNYLTDTKYKLLAGILLDTNLEVAGNGYLILSAVSDGIIKKVYDNYNLCVDFLNLLFDDEYNFVVITLDEWHQYRDEYIVNIKNGKEYKLLEYSGNVTKAKSVNDNPTIVDKLFDLVGEENIEFK